MTAHGRRRRRRRGGLGLGLGLNFNQKNILRIFDNGKIKNILIDSPFPRVNLEGSKSPELS